MSIYPSIADIPKNPAVRGAWIVFKLRVAGSSLKAVGDAEGVTKQAVSMAVSRAGGNGSSARLERAVAAALRLPVEALFSERYDQAGRRKRAVSKNHRTTGRTPGNGKQQEAA